VILGNERVRLVAGEEPGEGPVVLCEAREQHRGDDRHERVQRVDGVGTGQHLL